MNDLMFIHDVIRAIMATGAGTPFPLTRLRAIAGTAAANNASDVLLQCTYSNGDTRACRVTLPISMQSLHDGPTAFLGGLLVSEIGDQLTILSRHQFEERLKTMQKGASNERQQ